MPVDDRIRRGLFRNAEVPLPSVEDHLDAVVRRHRRRVAGKFVLVATAVVVLALLPLWALTNLAARDPDPARPSSSTLPGTYRVVIHDAGEAPELRGTWAVTFTRDGRVDLIPPATYRGPLSGGAAYELSGATVTTNAFVGSPGCQRVDPAVGVYRVVVTSGEAIFTRLDDTCPARAVLFGVPWERLP